jgi:hypothetical protein
MSTPYRTTMSTTTSNNSNMPNGTASGNATLALNTPMYEEATNGHEATNNNLPLTLAAGPQPVAYSSGPKNNEEHAMLSKFDFSSSKVRSSTSLIIHFSFFLFFFIYILLFFTSKLLLCISRLID